MVTLMARVWRIESQNDFVLTSIECLINYKTFHKYLTEVKNIFKAKLER